MCMLKNKYIIIQLCLLLGSLLVALLLYWYYSQLNLLKEVNKTIWTSEYDVDCYISLEAGTVLNSQLEMKYDFLNVFYMTFRNPMGLESGTILISLENAVGDLCYQYSMPVNTIGEELNVPNIYNAEVETGVVYTVSISGENLPSDSYVEVEGMADELRIGCNYTYKDMTYAKKMFLLVILLGFLFVELVNMVYINKKRKIR